MAKKKANNTPQQGQLFETAPQKYGWQPVISARKGTVMVVMNEDVTVSSVREENGSIYLSYNDPTTGTKTEQLYNHTDSIYVKL